MKRLKLIQFYIIYFHRYSTKLKSHNFNSGHNSESCILLKSIFYISIVCVLYHKYFYYFA